MNTRTILLLILLLSGFSLQAQKVLREGILVYNMAVETGSGEPKLADMLDGATTTIYLKGDMSKVELVSGLGKEATIHNASTGEGVILKEYSGQKLMIKLSAAQWKENNNKYDGISFENTGETKVIAGYKCQKAIARLKDGASFTVFYTNDVKVANNSYDSQFKNLDGLPVQYEMQTGKMKFRFTLSKISFEPVSSEVFEIPTEGYRIMSYEDTKAK